MVPGDLLQAAEVRGVEVLAVKRRALGVLHQGPSEADGVHGKAEGVDDTLGGAVSPARGDRHLDPGFAGVSERLAGAGCHFVAPCREGSVHVEGEQTDFGRQLHRSGSLTQR